MTKWIPAVVLSTFAGTASAASICSVNPFTQADAAAGKVAFDSHCALCHQYSMVGRVPGNAENEVPAMKLLSEDDLKFLDNAGGNVPPLIGPAFLRKWGDKSFTDFSTSVSGAANSFPTQNFEKPRSYFLITAYVIYRNCAKPKA